MCEHDFFDFSPDSCPKCGSDRTYWIDRWAFKCEDCNLIVDEDEAVDPAVERAYFIEQQEYYPKDEPSPI